MGCFIESQNKKKSAISVDKLSFLSTIRENGGGGVFYKLGYEHLIGGGLTESRGREIKV